MPAARAVEIFSAIQGEGANCGTRQIFVRFALCDLRCYFCDSANTWTASDNCAVEATPGRRNFETYPNPIPLDLMLDWVDRQNVPRLHDSVSITGGEPLLHAHFLREFLPRVKRRTGLPVYLETAGHRPDRLDGVLEYCDEIGMDIKLPSVSGEERWSAHGEFLQRCVEAGVPLFLKAIVSANTTQEDLDCLRQLVCEVDPRLALFLQPVTPLDAELHDRNQSLRSDAYTEQLAPSPQQVLDWQYSLKRSLDDVRVIPQTHKMLGQL
ncbi:MAG: 7-carboxy-7-deazaguanine synthase QueE [Geitlerinemataceae cyanobacterium]